MRKFFAAVLTIGVLVTAARLTAQQPPEVKPGPEHAMFKDEAGTWDATIKSMGSDSKGVMKCVVGLNGLWLLEHFKSDFGGMPFEGHGATSYDPTKKKYVNVWIDSMSTSPMLSEGSYDKATKTLTMVGDMPMPDGKTMKTTMTTTSTDANTKVFKMVCVAEGKSFQMMEITYKRRSK